MQAGLLPQGAGGRAGGPGLARDARPAHACGHESEPRRKRPHPAAGRAAKGDGAALPMEVIDCLLLLTASLGETPAPAARGRGFGDHQVARCVVRGSMQALRDGFVEAARSLPFGILRALELKDTDIPRHGPSPTVRRHS